LFLLEHYSGKSLLRLCYPDTHIHIYLFILGASVLFSDIHIRIKSTGKLFLLLVFDILLSENISSSKSTYCFTQIGKNQDLSQHSSTNSVRNILLSVEKIEDVH